MQWRRAVSALAAATLLVPTAVLAAGIVYEHRETIYDLDFDSTTWLWRGRETETSRLRVVAPEGLSEAGTFGVRHGELVRLKSVVVRLRHADSPGQSIEPELGYQDVSVPGVEHSDEKVRMFVIPGLRIGDRVEARIVREHSALWEAPSHVFGAADSVHHDSVEYRVPSNVEVAIRVRPGALEWPQPVLTRSFDHRKQVLRWDVRSLPGHPPLDDQAPPAMELMPVARIAASRVVRAAGDTLRVRKTWSDFAQWYESRLGAALEFDRAAVEWMVQFQVLAPDRSDLIESVFRAVRTRIRYVAVEVGEGAWIPHPVGWTLKNGYGDCKDMSAVLAGALRQAGIQARLALVLTDHAGSVDPDFPFAMQFNHCIVFVPDEAGDWWLDPTDEDVLPGEVSAGIAANPALILDGGNSRLATPQSRQGSESALLRSFTIEPIAAGRVQVVFGFEWIGNLASSARRTLRLANPEDRIRMAHALLSGSFAAVSDVVVAPPRVGEDPSRSIPVLRGRCTADNPVGSEPGAVVRRGLVGVSLPRIAATRPIPLETGAPRIERTRVQLRLPSAAVRDTTISARVAGRFVHLDVRTQLQGHLVQSDRALTWNGSIVPASQIRELFHELQSIRRSNDEILALPATRESPR